MPGTKKRAIFFLICGCFLVTPFQTAHSADNEITLKLNESIGKINGQTITLETPPALENSTTMVPIRFVAEAIGAKVHWDDTNRTITITQSGKTIQLVVDQKTAVVNGKAIVLDQSANIVNGTTLVPLRFIAENLDQKVTFNDSDQTISITNNTGQVPASAAKTTTVPAPEPRKRLDKIMADYLTKPGELSGPPVNPLFAANLPTTFEIMGVTSDNANNVYILEFNSFNSGSSYSIKKYDSRQSQLTTLIHINEKFNFDYQDKDHTQRKFTYLDFNPSTMYYDDLHDKLYVLGDSPNNGYIRSVLFQVLPEVKMISYQSSTDTMNSRNNFIATADGETFYYSNLFHDQIYLSADAGESKAAASYSTNRDNEILSVTNNGKIYLLDETKKTINSLDKDGVQTVAQINVNPIYGAAARNGYFYIADSNSIYKVSTNGEMEAYLNLNEIYHDEHRDQPYDTYSKVRFPLTRKNKFTVDANGNVIIWDGILCRINIFAY